MLVELGKKCPPSRPLRKCAPHTPSRAPPGASPRKHSWARRGLTLRCGASPTARHQPFLSSDPNASLLHPRVPVPLVGAVQCPSGPWAEAQGQFQIPLLPLAQVSSSPLHPPGQALCPSECPRRFSSTPDGHSPCQGDPGARRTCTCSHLALPRWPLVSAVSLSWLCSPRPQPPVLPQSIIDCISVPLSLAARGARARPSLLCAHTVTTWASPPRLPSPGQGPPRVSFTSPEPAQWACRPADTEHIREVVHVPRTSLSRVVG